jgi:DNA invertase Pin-like site-specific DNA recombinase
MSKRAAIYVRVSSEAQADHASPQEQEQDARAYCVSHGYQVVKIYADIARYKVGKRLVEPSATRSDRPQLKQMLADADNRVFDILIAWREDRLYRGVTAALLWISERVKAGVIEVELVKEYYDNKTAPVKAWAAGQELEAKHDRLLMGFGARLRSGKPLNNCPPYGYDNGPDGYLVVNEREAAAIQLIFKMFAKGESVAMIRRRLINDNIPSKKTSNRPWQPQFLYTLLNKKLYTDGYMTYHLGGVLYEVPVPAIIDQETAEMVRARFSHYHAYPAGNLRQFTLSAGLVYCAACNAKMQIVKAKNTVDYRCQQSIRKNLDRPKACANYRRVGILDAEIWRKLWALISEPGRFEAALEDRIQGLQAEEIDAGAVVESIEHRLGELTIERQKVIVWARKEIISEDDLKVQLTTLDAEERDLNTELNNYRLLIGNRAQRLIELAQLFREQVRVGWEAINALPADEEQAMLQFEFRKKLVHEIITRVDVLEDKSIVIYTQFDFNISISSAR